MCSAHTSKKMTAQNKFDGMNYNVECLHYLRRYATLDGACNLTGEQVVQEA